MDECPICLTSLENSSITMTGCCSKCMHSGCYFKCMALKPECPMCRAPQPPLEVVIPVPVVVAAPVPPSQSHKNFLKTILSASIFGIGLAVALWTVESRH